MRMILTIGLLALTTACSAQGDSGHPGKHKKGGKHAKSGQKKGHSVGTVAVAGLTRTGSLAVTESSGLALGLKPGTFYTHGDHGNRPELYEITQDGQLLSRIAVPGADNEDWEALASDDKGQLYLADVGNNGNDRHDLTIYRFDPKQPAATAARIRFHYADQSEFPPAEKAARNFDCEAVLWRGGTLYLFTRDRGQRRYCRVYALADTPGTAIAKPVGMYDLGAEVSGADISPDGRQLALIGNERLFLIDLPAGAIVGGKVRTVALPGARQAEGVVFIDDQTLAITTELGDIFRFTINNEQ